MNSSQRLLFLVALLLVGWMMAKDYKRNHHRRHSSAGVVSSPSISGTSIEEARGLPEIVTPPTETTTTQDTPQYEISSKVKKVTDWIRKKGKNETDKKVGGEACSWKFVDRGKRYSFFYSSHEKNHHLDFLSVWVRPSGTTANSKTDTFTDHHFDGQVDSAIGGNYRDSKRLDLEEEKKEGVEFRGYWQKRYDAAIDAALRHMK